jgi:hypothetical protein
MSSRLLQFSPVMASVRAAGVAPALSGVAIKSTGRA